MPFYNLKDINYLRDVATRIHAEMPYRIAMLSSGDIQRAANGVGPDSFPSIVRFVLTKLLPYADVATMVHDSEFAYVQDASKEAWEGANLRFYRNCLKRIKDLYGWYDPRRYLNQRRAAADYALLGGSVGWDAWTSAKSKYRSQAA